MAEILYQDNRILVCLKPPGILSTDEPGGLPDLLREQLGDAHACLRTVHRLDQAVGGVMVLARSREAARRLSAQVAAHTFEKAYLAAASGQFDPETGVWRDLLVRNRSKRKTYVADAPGKDVREATLFYRVLDQNPAGSLVEIRPETGRTHQIRAQTAAHGHPLLGDRKYGGPEGPQVGLWSRSVTLSHPQSGEKMTFSAPPPQSWPWCLFDRVEGAGEP